MRSCNQIRRSGVSAGDSLLRQVITHVALNAMPRRTALYTKRCFFRMAATAKVVELALEQRPHFLVGGVAVHAWAATGIVVVIVMAIDTVLGRMIRMRERHRQYRNWDFRSSNPAPVFLSQLVNQR